MEDLKKLKFFEALRFVVLFAACMAILAWAAFAQGCAADSIARRLDRALAERRSQDPATWSSGAEAGASSGVAGSVSSTADAADSGNLQEETR